MPDPGVIGMFYDKLKEIEVEDIEEARKRLSFIYTKPIFKKGDVVKRSTTDLENYIVHMTIDDKVYCQNILTYKIEIFEERELIKLYSSIEYMKPYQTLYNVAMNKIAEVNKNRFDK